MQIFKYLKYSGEKKGDHFLSHGSLVQEKEGVIVIPG
jgi:hypothetical protein